MLINALTIGLESTLDNNIMADAVMRDKFAQTLTLIFLYLKNFCSLSSFLLSWRWWKFNLSVVVHSNDSKNAGNKKCDKLHLTWRSEILMFSRVFYSHSWETKFAERQIAISISNKLWQAQVPSPNQVFKFLSLEQGFVLIIVLILKNLKMNKSNQPV